MAYTGGMFPTDTDTWLPGALEHPHRVEVITADLGTSYALEFVAGELALDEAWSPWMQATLTLAPVDDTVWSMLDPRTCNLILITPAYMAPGVGTREAAWPWALYVRRRRRNRRTGVITLELASGEALVQDWQWTDAATTHTITAATPCGAGVSDLLLLAVPNFDSTAYTSAQTAGTDLVLSTDQPALWPAVRELAERAGCQVWPESSPTLGRDWRMAASPTTPDAAKATALTTGAAGYVTGWEEVGARDDDWFNTVMVVYTAGGEGPVRVAEITGGVGGSSTAGKRVHIERRNVSAPAPGDNRAPQTIVDRAFRRGVEHVVDAVAAYWLQPRWSAYLPDNTLHLIKRVRFDLGAGTMTVTTRSA